jgi:hypothetical protein
MHIVCLKISRFSGARLADVVLGRRAGNVAGGGWEQRRIEHDAVEGIHPISADYCWRGGGEVTTARFVLDGSKSFDDKNFGS